MNPNDWNFGRARDARWAQQRFNGGGRDAKGRLFVLYPLSVGQHDGSQKDRVPIEAGAYGRRPFLKRNKTSQIVNSPTNPVISQITPNACSSS